MGPSYVNRVATDNSEHLTLTNGPGEAVAGRGSYRNSFSIYG